MNNYFRYLIYCKLKTICSEICYEIFKFNIRLLISKQKAQEGSNFLDRMDTVHTLCKY